jgi:Acetyltransferase (GNAT) domain
MNDTGATYADLDEGESSFRILHDPPHGPIEAKWRDFLAGSDYPAHYTAPEFFLEPAFRDKGPFAVLSMIDGDVTGVLTGTNDRGHVQSGLSVRPQIALSHRADPERGLANLVTGLLAEASSAKLVDLFAWSGAARLLNPGFHQRQYEGVVMLDLSQGPDALFRKFSENKRTNIKKAIKYGVSVEPARTADDISAYYAICVDWSLRKALPIADEDEFQQTFALTGNRVLFLARHEGKILAGVVIRFLPRGVMEYSANSSLADALRFRPNDLLHWRAIEWGCAEGMIKYSLGGTHLFLRKFGGEVVPTTRHRLDLSLLQRHALADWFSDKVDAIRPMVPASMLTLGRTLRGRLEKRHA